MRSVPAADRHLVTTLSDALARLARLENRAAVQSPGGPVSFSWSTLVVQVSPVAWQDHNVGSILTGLFVVLTTTGTSTTTVQVRHNGSIIAGSAVSLGSGVATSGFVAFTAPVAFAAFADSLQAEITAIGTGAAGLTVSVARS